MPGQSDTRPVRKCLVITFFNNDEIEKSINFCLHYWTFRLIMCENYSIFLHRYLN